MNSAMPTRFEMPKICAASDRPNGMCAAARIATAVSTTTAMVSACRLAASETPLRLASSDA